MYSSEVSYYLSRIQVSHPNQKRLFRYQLHQLIWNAFPSIAPGCNQPFLFHVTDRQDRDGIYCLVQSPTKPNWTIAQQQNRTNLSLRDNHEIKSISFEVKKGDQFFFQLQTCPIKNVFQGKDKRGIKVPIYDKIEIENWLLQRSEVHGFTLRQHEFDNEEMLVLRNLETGSKNIPLSNCQHRGVLQVKDEHKFTKAVTAGIGKKKIFGFGMLMLSPAI